MQKKVLCPIPLTEYKYYYADNADDSLLWFGIFHCTPFSLKFIKIQIFENQ
jgi:hypothetical protein